MNYFIKRFQTKARQSLLAQNQIFFKFPYALNADEGVISLPPSSVSRLSVCRHQEPIANINLQTPFFSVLIENEGVDGVVDNFVVAYFQEKEDAKMAKDKISRALLKPGVNFVKKLILFVVALALINQLFYSFLRVPLVPSFSVNGNSTSSLEGQQTSQSPNDLEQAQLAYKAMQEKQLAQLQSQLAQNRQNGAALNQPTVLPTPYDAQSEAPSASPGEELANTLRGKQ